MTQSGGKFKRTIRFRLFAVLGVFAAAYAALLVRAVDLQVLDNERLETRAQREFLRQVKIAPRRGIIYDRNQEELAVSLDTPSVYVRPLAVTNERVVGGELAKALDLPKKKVVAILAGEKRFVWLARRVTPAQAKAVQEVIDRRDLKGVGIVQEPRRFYPNTRLASHLLGFAGLDAKGLAGLELGWDRTLKGQERILRSMRDNSGRRLHLTPEDVARLPEGRHLILTIDKQVQYQTEKALAEAVEKYRASGGMAVVMLPRTGEILAMAVAPDFNPNVYARFPEETWRNRIITDAFEPGSTFKTFVAAAALRTNAVGLDQRFFCEEGAWRVGGRTIHDTHEHGLLDLAGIIKVSSNIGAAKVGQVVGGRGMYETFRAFGFGELTGVDLPGESRGILRSSRSWRPVELANIAFGQGVAVTALQLTQAVAAIANGGLVMRPYVVRAVVEPGGRLVKETQPEVRGRAMGAREARILTDMLVGVTADGGTGTRARVHGFSVAGKTGTAQKVMPTGGYSHTDYMSSFVGFLPAEDPRVVLLVTIDTPRGAHYGGTVAGPAFAKIAAAALEALGVQPTTPEPEPDQHQLLLEAKVRQISASGQPQAPESDPAAEMAQGRVPDLRGLTLRQALRLAAQGGLKVRAEGWGRVVEQAPKPGAELADTPSLVLTLSPAHGEG